VGLKCLFLHGIGNAGPEHAKRVPPELRPHDPNFMLRSTSPSADFNYWGTVPKYIPSTLCDNYFYTTESIIRGWDDVTIQQEFCLAIKVVNPDVVFTHSMANIVVAAGIGNEHPGCDLISQAGSTVNWYGIAGPLAGAESADLVVKLCSLGIHMEGVANFANDVVWKMNTESPQPKEINFFAQLKYCQPSYRTLKRDYVSAGSYVQLSCPLYSHPHNCITVRDIASELMKGSLCGFDPAQSQFLNGLRDTFDGLGLELSSIAVEATLKWQNGDGRLNSPFSGNDGFVGVSSCRIGKQDTNPYSTSSTSPFYAFDGNHRDASCFVSDYKTKNKQPCTWMANMVRRVQSTAVHHPIAPKFLKKIK